MDKKPIEDMGRTKERLRRYDLSIYASKKDTSPKMDVGGWGKGGGGTPKWLYNVGYMCE
jgi:hypothetical protein